MKAVRKQEWIGWQRKVYIYALIDPRSETIRYIGQAVDPSKRLWEHGHGLHGAKSVWIMLLREKGLSPKMVIQIGRASCRERV